MTILSDLDKWERATVADALEEATYPTGTKVIEQGQPGDDFFIIIQVGVVRSLLPHVTHAIAGRGGRSTKADRGCGA